jgi:hypothetical protein
MANVVCVSSKFDIFAKRLVQTSTLNKTKIGHKPTTAIDQSDLEFTVHKDDEHYLDRDLQLYIRVQLIGADGAELDIKITRLE